MYWLLIAILIGQATVIDGDTIRVGESKVRIWGLDAAEMDTEAGVRAKSAMVALVDGQEVKCEPNGDISYDRIVAQCFVDGTDLAEEMIRQGYAKPYCRFAGAYYNKAAKIGSQPECN